MKRHTALAFAFLLGALCSVVTHMGYVGLRNVKRFTLAEQCLANLKMVSAAATQYIESHDGAPPSSLQVLAEELLIEEERLRCPVSGQEYLYFLPGQPFNQDGVGWRKPMAAERGFPHPVRGEGMALKYYVLWDATVLSVSVQQLSGRLEDDPSKLEEMLRPRLPPEGG